MGTGRLASIAGEREPVSDRFDDDGNAPASPAEGVRILGAEEAQAALDAGTVRAVEPEPAAPPPAPDDGDDPARFPKEGPSWSAATPTDAVDPPETPTGEMEVPPLPHWSEPATGAVPAIFADDEADDADPDLDAWASLSGSQPRFRAEGADWAEADFVEGDLAGGEARVGALSNEAPVDEDVAFAEALEKRKPRGPSPRRAPAAPRRRSTQSTFSHDPARPNGANGRDLPSALATAAIIAAIALLCFKLGTAWTGLLSAVIVGACALEFANGLQEKGFRPATLIAALGSGGLVLAGRTYGVDAYPVFFALVTVFS
ncbi:MAG: phosphatidate cytidylyltransferase, partial [Actinomycetota bacterium]|nr:phosphatidate cytidylyltransferase [Actinomycetota bacterium]